MNDPKDIVVSIENIENIKEENTLIQSPTEENKENPMLAEETRLNNLLFHLYENLGKRFYKKTLKEIDLLIQNNYLKGYSREWKIYILKIRGILKIIKKKIKKYLILHLEKAKIKHHINNIKKYLNQVPIELNNFFDNFIDENTIYEGDKIDNLLRCYFEYIYLYSFFHKKIGNFIESISFLSFIIRLNKETQSIVKSERTISHIEKCFILLCQNLIYNEDYFSTIEYINLTMEICFKHILFNAKDLLDGIYMGDKDKLLYLISKKENIGLNKNKFENEIENNYGEKKIKRVIMNIIFIYFYRAICYENIGKIKNSIKCYYQCLWFINHFFYDTFKHFSYLIKNILDKSIEFKSAIDYLEKKIIYYDRIQIIMKKQNKKNESDKEEKNSNKLYNNNSFTKKYKGLINKLSNLKINEIDTVNKFEIKKNIKDLSARKREGKDKNIFLSDIRLLEAYLREDFRDLIDNMNKIKSFDMDFSTREKIQKYLRRIYFEQNQREINKKKVNKINKINKINALFLSRKNIRSPIKNKTSIIKYNDFESNKFDKNLKNSVLIKKKDLIPIKTKLIYSSTFKLTQLPNENYITLKSPKSCKNLRPKSTFSEKSTFKTKRIFSPLFIKSDIKNHTINTIKRSQINIKKNTFIQKYKKMKINSAKVVKKIETENKELNRFFNKKYLQKRNYIKKLEDRELKFQKCILKLKDTPKSSFEIYNKEVMKQNATESFQKMLTLFISNPVNWKENLSPKEVKNIMLYDKLESAMIKSLDRNAFIKFKNEENKRKIKKYYSVDKLNLSIKDINNYNKNIIKNIDNKLEELKQRVIIEKKNYQKLLIRNRKYLKYNNERKSQKYNINYGRGKYKSANISPISHLKKFSFSDPNIFNTTNYKKSFSKFKNID